MKEKITTWLESMKKNHGTPPKKSVIRKSHVPMRLNFLFFIVFILFVALIIQLSYLQIVNGSIFKENIASSTKKAVQTNAPRGMIYDSSGKALVSNQANQAIVFTRSPGMDAEDLLKLANKLNKLIDVPAEDLTTRDKKDYWLANTSNYKQAEKRLSKSEKVDKNGNELSSGKLYSKIVDKVTDQEISFDAQTLKAATIFKKMNGAYSLTPTFIKNTGVSNEEIAIIGENTADLSGISTGMDWTRSYPYGDTMSTILGTVSTEKAGLPADDINYYLTKGYSRNDRVGLSYLEKQYESVLRGTKAQTEVTLNKKQEIVDQTTTYAGEKGDNLMLTMNLDFQQKTADILKKYYQSLITSGAAKNSPGAYVVVTNPQNGEVLAMTGLTHDTTTGALEDDTLGTINKSFEPGSVVKGATISAGYEQKVISGNQVLIDEPIKLQSSASKSSWFNRSGQIALSAEQALELSSNAYMMKIVYLMLGQTYTPNSSIKLDTSVFKKLRSMYAQYGLGTSTGIDLPGESSGLVNSNLSADDIMGKALDLSYGNYDTYTALQLAQYVSTIANGGKRIAPHIVKGIYSNDSNGNLGDLKQMVTPKILNQVDISQDELAIIKQGFYNVVHGSNANRTGSLLQDAKMDVAGKTGTAETFAPNANDPQNPYSVVTSTFIGYAPASNPKVAVSVVLPRLENESAHANLLIAKEIFNLYADMYGAN